MGQEPDEIRREIEATRARMGGTVDALTYKTDVKSRVSDSISQKKDSVTGTVGNLLSKVSGSTPDGGDIKQQGRQMAGMAQQRGRQAVGMAQQNPLGLAIGAAAVGFLAGLVIPSLQVEHDKLGEASDQVKSKALETGQEALDRGKQVATDVAQSASDTAKESGQHHAQELSQSAQQNAHEAAQGAQASFQE